MMKNYDLYKHEQLFTIRELVDYCAKSYGDKTAFMYSRKKQAVNILYNEFKASVEAFGTYLLHEGFSNSHIAVFGENSYEWILSHFSVTCSGNVIVPIDKDLESQNVSELLNDSECKMLIYSDTYSDIADELKSELPNILFINMNEISSIVKNGRKLIAEGYSEYFNISVSKDDLASIVYTSGTTGKSKGVMLTHGNITIDTVATCQNVLIEGATILLLPLHHMFGLVAGVMSVLLYGYCVYINSSLKRIMDDFQTAKPQHLSIVPLIIETLYNRIWAMAVSKNKDKALKLLIGISNFLLKFKIDLRKKLFKSVLSAFGKNLETIISGGAPIDTKYIKGFQSFGITIINGYGITECGPVVATNRNLALKNGSVGFPLCCNNVKIADNGEVLVKGDNVMLGYFKNEEENKKVFVNGWFKTGDVGFIDEDGALHITGRIKNLIILSNGENISAESIEEQVYTIPYIKEVIAYGKDNTIIAEVYLDEEVPDAKERINEDIAQLNKKLPLIKNIGRVVIRDTEFPKTTTKKIKRNYTEV